jgi:hypothetical protein
MEKTRSRKSRDNVPLTYICIRNDGQHKMRMKVIRNICTKQNNFSDLYCSWVRGSRVQGSGLKIALFSALTPPTPQIMMNPLNKSKDTKFFIS